MRAVWAIAAVILAAAIAAAVWSPGGGGGVPAPAEAPRDATPGPVTTVCPMPPEVSVPALPPVPASKALDELAPSPDFDCQFTQFECFSPLPPTPTYRI